LLIFKALHFLEIPELDLSPQVIEEFAIFIVNLKTEDWEEFFL